MHGCGSAQVRTGNVVEIDGRLLQVRAFRSLQHSQMWRGVAQELLLSAGASLYPSREPAVMTLISCAGRRLQVVKQQHTQGTGRQHGTVQLELRDLATRTKQQERRRPGDQLEVVRLEGRPYQFLYREGAPGCCPAAAL